PWPGSSMRSSRSRVRSSRQTLTSVAARSGTVVEGVVAGGRVVVVPGTLVVGADSSGDDEHPARTTTTTAAAVNRRTAPQGSYEGGDDFRGLAASCTRPHAA